MPTNPLVAGTVPTPEADARRRKRRKDAKLDIPDAVAHLQAGLSLRQAADIQGVHKSTLHEALGRYGISVDRVRAYQQHRADVMSAIQERMAEQVLSMPDARLAKEALPLMSSLGIAYDKERLERGQSTANVALVSVDLSEFKPPAE